MEKDRIDFSSFHIENFSPAPIQKPIAYPGKRPQISFVFEKEFITPIQIKGGKKIEESLIQKNEDRKTTLEKYLEQSETNNLKDRYMVIGYGSNVNPAQLQIKFKNIEGIIPVLKGQLKDYDVAFAAFSSPYGAIPATIEQSKGTTVEVWANFLDEKQMELMDKTEGRENNYWLVKIDTEIILENGERFSPVYSYLATSGVLSYKENPLRFIGINAEGKKFKDMNEIEVLKILYEKLTVIRKFENFEEFMEKLRNDKTYQDQVNEFLKNNLSLGIKLEYTIIPPLQYPKKMKELIRHF